MKPIAILYLILFANFVSAQVDSSFANVIFIGKHGEDLNSEYNMCNRPGAVCSTTTINPENENENYENENYQMHAKFYINSSNTLFLSFERNSIPLEVLIEFFQYNYFKINTQYHLPDFVINKLNIDNSHKIIPGGIYPIFESEDKTEIIVNFGSLESNNNNTNQIKSYKYREEKTTPIYNYERENQ